MWAWLMSFFVTANPAAMDELELRALNVFDVIMLWLKAKSAGHPLLLRFETWVQEVVSQNGQAALDELEALIVSHLARKTDAGVH